MNAPDELRSYLHLILSQRRDPRELCRGGDRVFDCFADGFARLVADLVHLDREALTDEQAAALHALDARLSQFAFAAKHWECGQEWNGVHDSAARVLAAFGLEEADPPGGPFGRHAPGVRQRRHRALLSVQSALLGLVTPAIRAVVVEPEEGRVSVHVLHDGPAESGLAAEIVARIGARVAADHPRPDGAEPQVHVELHRADWPEPLPEPSETGGLAYLRAEPARGD